MKRILLLALSVILILTCCISVSAHSGKTDGAGGHYDNSTGEYHYHHGYPAHSHDGGCPYDYDDKTDHSPGNSFVGGSSSGSGCNSSEGGVIVIIIVVIIIAAFAFCFWLMNGSGSSGSKATAVPTPSPGSQQQTNFSNSKITELENEIRNLNTKNSSLESSLRSKENLIQQLNKRIAELESTDSQQKIDQQSRRIAMLTSSRDDYLNRLNKLTYKQSEIKKLQAEPKTVVQVQSDPQDKKKIQDLNCRVTTLVTQNNELQNKVTELERSTTYSDNIFAYAMKNLDTNGDKLFYSYPSVREFYQQVTDKRFHRSQVEDISFAGKISIQASILSSKTTYKTSLSDCNCVDYQRTNSPCKHMLFLAYQSGVLLLHKDEVEKSLKIYLDELRNTKVPKK